MAVTIIPYLPGSSNLESWLANNQQMEQTRGQAIENQYSPERLRLANALKQNELNFAPRKSEADIGYTEAQIPYTRALTNEANARVPLIQSQVDAAKMKAKYPGLGEPGIAGQIAHMQYMAREHPELAKEGGEFQVTQNGTNVPQGGVSPGTQPLPQNPQQQQKLQNMFGQQQTSQPSMPLQQLQRMMGQQNVPGMPGTYSPLPQQSQLPQSAPSGMPGGMPQQNMGSPLQVDPNSLIGLMHRGINGKMGAESARTNFLNAQTSGMPWNRLPPNEKLFNLAQARAFGYNSDEASKEFLNGKTLRELAQQKGLDPNDPSKWPVARSAPTMAMQTQQQRANVAQAGIRAIEGPITEIMAPYAKRWNGVSLKQLSDSLKGGKDEEIGKAIGAGAVAQDLALLRARSGGVNNIGIEMLRKSLEGSLTDMHTNGLLTNPKQFISAQKTIGELLTKLNKAENKELYKMSEDTYSEQEKEAHQMSNEELANAMKEAD